MNVMHDSEQYLCSTRSLGRMSEFKDSKLSDVRMNLKLVSLNG